MSERFDKALRRYLRLDALMLKAKWQIRDFGGCKDGYPNADGAPCWMEHRGYEKRGDPSGPPAGERCDVDDVEARERQGDIVAWWWKHIRNEKGGKRVRRDLPIITGYCRTCRRTERLFWWAWYLKRKRSGALTTLRAAFKAEEKQGA